MIVVAPLVHIEGSVVLDEALARRFIELGQVGIAKRAYIGDPVTLGLGILKVGCTDSNFQSPDTTSNHNDLN
jgi:hypothetical protein